MWIWLVIHYIIYYKVAEMVIKYLMVMT